MSKEREQVAGPTSRHEVLDRFMRRSEVLKIAGFSATTLWREVRRGRFPPPMSTSRGRVGWLESRVNSWLRERASNIKINAPPD
jgi:prophage regulatory protein